MNTLIISAAAIVMYLLATTRLTTSLFGSNGRVHLNRGQFFGLCAVAVALHGVVLYQNILTTAGLNLGFFHASSLIAWVIIASLLTVVIWRPMENLAVLLLPMAALALTLEVAIPSRHLFAVDAEPGLQTHILLSLLAYSVLSISALQAVLLAVQEYALRRRQFGMVMRALPPLRTMENLLFQLIGSGFFLLSLSLLSGIIFLENIFAQHLVHKTVLSILAWLVFATLLWGRWRYGWRSTKAVRWTLGGFISLALAYFGSKLVLELILGRV